MEEPGHPSHGGGNRTQAWEEAKWWPPSAAGVRLQTSRAYAEPHGELEWAWGRHGPGEPRTLLPICLP